MNIKAIIIVPLVATRSANRLREAQRSPALFAGIPGGITANNKDEILRFAQNDKKIINVVTLNLKTPTDK